MKPWQLFRFIEAGVAMGPRTVALRSFACRRICIVAIVAALVALMLAVGPARRAGAASVLPSQGQPATASSLENASVPAADAGGGDTRAPRARAFSRPH